MAEPVAITNLMRRCTYSERPFGDEAFVAEIEQETGRKWLHFNYEAELKELKCADFPSPCPTSTTNSSPLPNPFPLSPPVRSVPFPPPAVH